MEDWLNSRMTAIRLVATFVAATVAMSAGANNLVNFATVTNTDFAMFGYGGMSATGLPTDGTGTITVSGISGTVHRAVLIWHGPTNSASNAVNAAVTFNGTPITGFAIGTSDSNCWSNFANSRAYQADVTTLVGGNGTYALSNFVKGSYPNPTADINGVSLLVFYDDGNAANNRDIVVFLGNDSNRPNAFDSAGWTVTLNGVNYASGAATLRLIIADGQNIIDPENVSLNATVIYPGGQNFDGITVPNGPAASDPDINGGLWDHKATSIATSLTPGTNDLTLSSPSVDPAVGDCLSLVSTIFDLPPGAAPPSPLASIIPTLSEWGLALLTLLMGGFAALQLRRRRT